MITLIKRNKGFSIIKAIVLLAVILVLGIAGMRTLSTNSGSGGPTGKARDAIRRSDVAIILDAVISYDVDRGIEFLSIPTGGCSLDPKKEICKQKATRTCSSGVDLTDLISQRYLGSIPTDPSGSSTDGSGYYISKKDDRNVIVCAPNAESGEPIFREYY